MLRGRIQIYSVIIATLPQKSNGRLAVAPLFPGEGKLRKNFSLRLDTGEKSGYTATNHGFS
jgi:hypothetical protein